MFFKKYICIPVTLDTVIINLASSCEQRVDLGWDAGPWPPAALCPQKTG